MIHINSLPRRSSIAEPSEDELHSIWEQLDGLFERNIESKEDLGKEIVISQDTYSLFSTYLPHVEAYCAQYGYKPILSCIRRVNFISSRSSLTFTALEDASKGRLIIPNPFGL